jgi:hypothetical protein
MLSAMGVAVPDLVNLGRVAAPAPHGIKPAGSPLTAAPYTPQQVETAYGVNLISFNGVVGDGSGQTIAIVDAYNDPNIITDTAAFNTRFGLQQFNVAGGPTFQVLNQTGGTTLPMNTNTTTGEWDLEEALDVQWAHSMAPKANIILFESTTANDFDMNTAEVTAAGWPGVSVISNSWGEGEFSGETSEDSALRTPTGHQGVTFLASTGDSGTPAGYPAYSPEVVAVGGTNLQIQSNGTYTSESAWSSGGGGISTVESIPSYQSSIAGVNGASSTFRNVPDISADADPASGVYVNDTWFMGQGGGYFQVGGTSLSSPLWGGFMAIVNQGRALAGEATLDGYSQTLPMLYSLPSSDFHDVTTGNNGTYSAAAGYDLTTGRGTPIANLIVPALAGYGSTPPSISAPAAVNAAWNVGNAYNGGGPLPVSVTDPFSAGNADSYTFSVSHGTVTLLSLTGLTVIAGVNGSASVTVSGTVANLNADLNLRGLLYRASTDYIGPDSLVVSATDPGDSLTGTATVAINVVPFPPFLVTGPAVSIGENSTLAFNGANRIEVGEVGAALEQMTLSVSHGTLSFSATTNLTVTGNGTASVALTGHSYDISADLGDPGYPLPPGRFTYTPIANYTGPDTLNLSITNTISNLTGTASVSITIVDLAVNAPATAITPQNTAVTFSSANGNRITLTDTSSSSSDSVSVSASNGTVTLGSTTGLTFTSGTNGSSSFTVDGTLGNLSSALSFLTYLPNFNYIGPDALAVSLTDGLTALNTSATVALTVGTVTAPSIVAPATATVSENGSLVFSAANGNPVSFTDNGAGVNSDLLTLSVSHGTLTLGSTTGLTLTAGSNGSASFTVNGTVSNLNNALSGMTYTPTLNVAGSDSLSILVSDPTDGKSGSGSVAITVRPFAPSITAPISASLTQNGSFVFLGGNTISVADANSGAVDSLSLSVTDGTLTLSTTSGLTFPSGSNGTATFTVSGTVANLNAALSGLVYAPTTNYVGSDSLAMSISDPGDGLSASKNVSLTINSLPAPTIGAPASATMQQNSSLVFSSANGDAISVADSAAGSNSDSLTLSVAHGTLTLSTTSGLNFTSGTNGSASFTVTGSIANLNAALSGLKYQPASGYTGSDSLAISLADTVDSLSASKNVALTVSNSPPAITAPSAATVLVTSTLVFSPAKGNTISIADGNAGTAVEPLTLTATDGTLLLGSTTGITVTAGANGSASMTISGTLAALNNALNGLTFRPIALGSATVVLSYTDVGTAQLASATINITVTRLVFRPGQVIASSSASSAVRASSVSGPNGGGTVTLAATPATSTGTLDDSSLPPDTQLAGFAAAVQMLVG